jgi:hypothetical protein
MNYTELVENIRKYCESNEADFVASIPTFVRQTEERLYRLLNLPEFKGNATGTMTANNRYLSVPNDALSILSLAVIDGYDYHFLIDKDQNFMREAYPNPNTTGRPRFYSYYNGTSDTGTASMLLGPTPDQNYPVEIQYTRDPPSIVDVGQTWIGDNASTALLYGCLVEAYTFLKGDPGMMQVYKDRYTEALGMMGVIDTKTKRDNFRDGEPRA